MVLKGMCGVLAVMMGYAIACPAQATPFAPGTLDPARDLAMPSGKPRQAAPMPEQYIWLKGSPLWTLDQPSHPPKIVYFRRTFLLKHSPRQATLYFAGPHVATIYLNGKRILHASLNPDPVMDFPVSAVPVAGLLHSGSNTLAIKMIQDDVEPAAFVAKIVPASRGVDSPPVLVSDSRWRGTASDSAGWENRDFNDSAWPHTTSFGAINGNVDFREWNNDGGLYDWPGYTGVATYLARYPLKAARIEDVLTATSSLENIGSLTHRGPIPEDKEFTVSLAAPVMIEQNAPSIVLDFGKEVSGWVQLTSDSNSPVTVTVQYGESKGALENDPYLGINPVYIPPKGTAHGPKSAFRYAEVRFVAAKGPVRFKSIQLNGIYYPVRYLGSFSSSDPMLNKIWEVGAYTAHLCMQDDIWDAPKRDRARWAGDLDVSGDVIDSVFLDHFLMQDTMTRLVGPLPITQHVNGIPGYSAMWIMALGDYERHTGQRKYLASLHGQLVGLLDLMKADIGANGLYDDPEHEQLFVDWSPYFHSDTPQARMATDFEYYAGFRRGAELLKDLGDTKNAQRFKTLAASMKKAAQPEYLDPRTGSFGARWQTNAMAIYSGIAEPQQYHTIWQNVLSKVGTPYYNALIISPYYGYYVISAMAETDHRKQALEWIRKYWGGMIDEGATSFWEAYDPSWPKTNFHSSLLADGMTGYRTSLAHGWSSGPTAWLMEQILGIQPTSEGFGTVTIRPDLAGLAWAKGTEPTPHGLIKVDLQGGLGTGLVTDLTLPGGVRAKILVPVSAPGSEVMVNGQPMNGQSAEGGRRLAIEIGHAGRFRIVSK